ncbi:hypothetical protein ACE2AJ_08365 [Aquihabitans daechungensis]|uniref:hypothetical protein n=1 Tax=Aquihabitans daechungensis TaxID=1052257 RepID=UPI003B9FB23F
MRVSPSSTSSSEPGARDPITGTPAEHEAPAPALGDAPADDHGGHQVRPVTHRRNRSVVLWALGCTAVALLVAELVVRALAPLPANRTWPDAESQFKAEHAASVRANGGTEPLIFAGSSVADTAFDPAVVAEAAGFDGESFNYSQEGSLSSTTARFLEAAVLDEVDPDTVVLGVYPGDIGAAPTNAAALGDELSRSRGYRLASGNPTLGDRIDDAFSRRSDLIAHREILRDPYRLAQWLRTPTTPAFLDAATGSLLRHRDATYTPPDPAGDDGGDELAPIEPEVEAIEDLADTLASQGKRLVVVELPVYQPGWDAEAGPEARRRTHQAMVDVEEAGCAERLDLRSLVQEDRYWSDAAHVNGEGTEEISRAVGEWLAANPDAPADC